MEKIAKLKTRSKKRLGRGYGSGKGGHTVGRGQKGQNVRGHLGTMFAGMKTKKSLIKKIPLRRGKGKFQPLKQKPLPVDVSLLDLFNKGDEITVAALVKRGIISPKDTAAGVKILGNSALSKSLTVLVPCSRQAAGVIEAAGGTLSAQKKVVSKKKVSAPKAKKA